MEFDKVVKGRRSVRSFSKKEVSLTDVSKILDLARKSPSSGNVQNWVFIVVKEKLKDIVDCCYKQESLERASCLVVVCSRMKEVSKLYGKKGKELYAVQNTAIAAHTIMLKATDLGVGSCWIGGFDAEKVKSVLGVPTGVDVHSMIALGYGRGEKSVRDQLETMVFFDKWKKRERDYGIWPLKKYIGGKLKRLNKR